MIKNKINGKMYIGSSVNINKRWTEHKNALKDNKHHSVKFQRSYNKYGEHNFEFCVIEYIEDKINLIKREQYYIDFYKAEEIGYNICPTAGSSLGRITSDETKQKLKVANIGKKPSEETKKKMSENNARIWKGKKFSKEYKEKISIGKKDKYKGENSPLYGRKLNQETKNKISKSNKGKQGFWKGKSHTDETKNKISKIRKERGLAVGENNPMFGKNHTDDTKNKISAANSVKVVMIDKNCNYFIKIFNSIRDAEKEMGIHNQSITNVCKKKLHHKTAGGYKWVYLSDLTPLQVALIKYFNHYEEIA
jgi:group I intron endonuclease